MYTADNYISVEEFAMNTKVAALAHLHGEHSSPLQCNPPMAANPVGKPMPLSYDPGLRREKAAMKCCSKEKESTMRTMSEIKNYFSNRVDGIYYDREKEMGQKYGLYDDMTPQTAKEIVERIQAGKYILPGPDTYDYGVSSIKWRDPSVKTDKEGFDAAHKALKAARQSALDQIMQDETKAMDAAKAFEAWTYTPVTPVIVTA